MFHFVLYICQVIFFSLQPFDAFTFLSTFFNFILGILSKEFFVVEMTYALSINQIG